MSKTVFPGRPRWRSIGLAILYLVSTNGPAGIALAAPGLFVRPGAGVSRLPLQVTAFNAPGFGDLNDAINLASGNLYLDLGAAARNSTLTARDETTGTFAGNWNLKARLRLAGFSPALLLPDAPVSLSVLSGDGSARTFAQVTATEAIYASAPRWIERYKNFIDSASGQSRVRLYRSQPQPGTENVEAWLVLARDTDNSAYAYLYEHDGTRTAWHNSGEFPDFEQTLSQQYRGARAGDASGYSATTKKTKLTYASGRLTQLQDEWGRITTYAWNPDSTLKSIRYQPDPSVSDDALPSSAARKVDFFYTSNLLDHVTYTASNGLGGYANRTYTFRYTSYNGTTVLQKIARSIPSEAGKPGGTFETTYSYGGPAAQPWISTVSEPGVRDTVYSYVAGGSNKNGQLVTVTQTAASGLQKQSKYHFDTLGRLRKKTVSDRNPDIATSGSKVYEQRDKTLVWNYDYYDSGFLAVENETYEGAPIGAGQTTHYAYDAQGNLIRRATYTSNPLGPNPPKPPVGVTLADPQYAYSPGEYITMIATVTGDPSNSGVTWRSETEPERITQADLSSSSWTGYWAKPTVTPGTYAGRFGYQLSSMDSGNGSAAYYSGVLRQEAGPAGRYVVSFDGRTTTGTLDVQYGLDDGYTAGATLTPSWRTFTTEFDAPNGVNRLFQLLEYTQNNPVWQVANISVRYLGSDNFATDPNLTSGYWEGYFSKPSITPGIAAPGGNVGYQLASWDGGGPGGGYSGVLRAEAGPAGRYKVSFDGRTVSGTLGVGYGLADAFTVGATLTSQWQHFEQNFDTGSLAPDRLFEVFETTVGNPAWQVANVRVQYLGASGSSVPSYAVRFLTPNRSTANFQEYTITAYSRTDPNAGNPNTADSTKYARARIEVQPTAQKIELYAGGENGAARINVGSNTNTGVQFGARIIPRPGRVLTNEPLQWSVAQGPGTISQSGYFTPAAWSPTLAQNNGLVTSTVQACLPSQQLCQTANVVVGYTRIDWAISNNDKVWSSNSDLQFNVSYTNPVAGLTGLTWSDPSDGRVTKATSDGCYHLPPQSVFYPGPYYATITVSSASLPGQPPLSTTFGWSYRSNNYSQCTVPNPQLGSAASIAQGNLYPANRSLYLWRKGGNGGLMAQDGSRGTISAASAATAVIISTDPGLSMQAQTSGGQPFFAQALNDQAPLPAISLNPQAVTANAPKSIKTDSAIGTTTEGEPSSALQPNHSGTERFAYDRDNRLTLNAKPPVGSAPLYRDWREEHTYADFPQVTVNTQTFTLTQAETTTTKVGATGGWDGVASSGGTVLRRVTDTDLGDFTGRLDRSVLIWNTSQTRTTQYSYAVGGATTLPGVDASGTSLGSAPKALQFADQAQQVQVTTSDGLSQTHSYLYDPFGNVVQDTFINAVASDLVNGTPMYSSRVTSRSYNGFGQKTWERVALASGQVAGEQVWNYADTGELLSSWSGRKDNLTAYAYDGAGRMLTMKRGVASGTGAAATVPSPHQTITYGYDDFGNQNFAKESGTVETAGTSTTFDSLDRPVQQALPDGSVTHLAYDEHGQLARQIGPKATHVWERDVLGRVMTETLSPVSGPALSTSYQYDNFDRIIRSVPSDPGIVSDPVARDTTFRYDEEGHLLFTVGPKLRTTSLAGGTSYADGRRPAVKYDYDALGRRTTETKALNGLVSSATGLTSGAALVTTTQYDGLDRPVSVVDNNGAGGAGYGKTMTYDPAGNLLTFTQVIARSGDVGYSAASATATTSSAYDAAGRLVKTVDPAGRVRTSAYDALGNVISVSDETGKVAKGYTYTPDGLLEGTYQPAFGKGGATSFDRNSASFTLTSLNVYGGRPYPSATYRANMNGAPSVNGDGTIGGGTRVEFTYDYAGRPLKTVTSTAPSDRVVTQTYNEQGKPLSITDADGFGTSYTYDQAGRILSESRPPRKDAGGAVLGTDSSAGFASQGLTSSFVYDAYGNLVRKTERGLVTDYAYNSLGKPIAESRPRSDAAATPQWRYFTYALDGNKTAETSYAYAGDLLGKLDAPAAGSGGPTVSGGNLRVYELDLHGNVLKEASTGWTGGTTLLERSATYLYNGLDKRVKRSFTGYGGIDRDELSSELNDGIYAPLRTASGMRLKDSNNYAKTAYDSYWTYDARGLLTRKWDTYDGGAGERSVFSYTYTETGKEQTASRDVRSVVQTPGADADAPGGTVLLAASVGSTTSRYNERGLLASVTTSDQSATGVSGLGAASSRTTVYGYYPDGSRSDARVYNADLGGVSDATLSGSTHTTYYDDGREQAVTDSNGTQLPPDPSGASLPGSGAATTATTYDNAGVRTTTTTWANGYSVKRIETPTLAGLGYKTEEARSGGANPTVSTVSTTAYTASGLPSQSVQTRSSAASGQPTSTQQVTTTFAYNPDQTEQQQTVTTQCSAGCSGGFTSTRTSSYDASGNLTREDYARTGATGDFAGQQGTSGSFSTSYDLDSRGRRLKVHDTRGDRAAYDNEPANYNGYWKRYDADDQVSLFFRRQPNATDGGSAAGPAPKDQYNEFFNDPQGNEVLSSTGGVLQAGPNQKHLIVRDVTSTFLAGQQVVQSRKRSGSTGWRYDTNLITNYYTAVDTYSGNDGYRDESYTLADGLYDGRQWTGVVLFSALPGSAGTVTLEAPVEPVSFTVRLDPVGVLPPVTANPSVSPPDTVKPPSTEGTSTSNTSTSATSSVQTFSASQALPGLNASQESSFGVTLQAPSTVVPSSLGSIGTTAILAPLGSGLPGLPDPGTVSAPGQISPPTVGSTPSDGVPTITPPTPSDAGTPGIPQVTPPGQGVPSVTPPIGTRTGTVSTQDAWHDFLGWLADQSERAKNAQEAEDKRVRDEAQQLADRTGNKDYITAANLRIADRHEIIKLFGRGSEQDKQFNVIASNVFKLPPGEQIKFYARLAYNEYTFAEDIGKPQALKGLLARLQATTAAGAKSGQKTADGLWGTAPGLSLSPGDSEHAKSVVEMVGRGMPAWLVDKYVRSANWGKGVWDNSWKPGVYGGLVLLGVAGGVAVYAWIAGTDLAIGTSATVATAATGTGATVWNNIKPVLPNYPGTQIPQSFELMLANGQRVYVVSNATEHILELVNRTKGLVYINPLTTQMLLSDLKGAVDAVTKNGIVYNQIQNAGRWELMFRMPKNPGQLPALVHAQPK